MEACAIEVNSGRNGLGTGKQAQDSVAQSLRVFLSDAERCSEDTGLVPAARVVRIQTVVAELADIQFGAMNERQGRHG